MKAARRCIANTDLHFNQLSCGAYVKPVGSAQHSYCGMAVMNEFISPVYIQKRDRIRHKV